MSIISLPAINIKQPIGNFFIGAIDAYDLIHISFADIRGIEEGKREVVEYSGIQRRLVRTRVHEIAQYVTTLDATFPTAIVLAIPEVCATFKPNPNDSNIGSLELSEYKDSEDPGRSVEKGKIAKIIDGQHRIAGLEKAIMADGVLKRGQFVVNVTIFIEMDIADQANIFSTVNLHQTKVNKSLAYDLYEYETTRSPQKTCHAIAVVLDSTEGSPFFQKIKRLGFATDGRLAETLTQATVVESLLSYITDDIIRDRDALKRNKPLPSIEKNPKKYIFRNYFASKKDADITKIIWTYFDVVRKRWPKAWNRNPGTNEDKGYILNKTNGFRSFMRLLEPLYWQIVSSGGEAALLKKASYEQFLNKVTLKDDDFNVDEYPPGSSGEAKLLKTLLSQSGLER